MNKLSVVVVAFNFFLAANVHGMSMRIVPERESIPEYSAFGGVLEVTNDTGQLVRLDCPSFVRGTLWFELVSGGEVVECKMATTIPVSPRKASLGPGEMVLVPFIMMTENGKFYFDTIGEYQVKAMWCEAGRYAARNNKAQVVASPPVVVDVYKADESDDWKQEFSVSADPLMVFGPVVAESRLHRFVGTSVYHVYRIYMAGGGRTRALIRAGQNVDAEIYNGVESELKSNSPGSDMWAYFRGGKSKRESDVYGNGDYVIDW